MPSPCRTWKAASSPGTRERLDVLLDSHKTENWRYTKMSATLFGKPVEILLVEDNPGDVDLTQEALENSKIRNTLSVAVDGEEAMDFLRRRGKFEAAPRPDLILLDLNMPKKDGREVLAEIKADDDLRRIPVVIMTSSDEEKDVFESYNLHANCYITKPIDLHQFLHVVKAIEDFWLTIVSLPPKGAR
jgi:CheY-like chemotaxis protein